MGFNKLVIVLFILVLMPLINAQTFSWDNTATVNVKYFKPNSDAITTCVSAPCTYLGAQDDYAGDEWYRLRCPDVECFDYDNEGIYHISLISKPGSPPWQEFTMAGAPGEPTNINLEHDCVLSRTCIGFTPRTAAETKVDIEVVNQPVGCVMMGGQIQLTSFPTNPKPSNHNYSNWPIPSSCAALGKYQYGSWSSAFQDVDLDNYCDYITPGYGEEAFCPLTATYGCCFDAEASVPAQEWLKDDPSGIFNSCSTAGGVCKQYQ